MLNTQKATIMGTSLCLTMALVSAVGCGSNSGDKTSDPNKTNKTPAAMQQTPQQEAEQALNTPAGQSYLAAAQKGVGAGPICQDELTAITDAMTKASQDPSAGIDAIQTAVQAFAKCVESQVSGMPGMPMPGTGAVCMAVSDGTDCKQTGDCTNCKVTKTAGGCSVSCSSTSGSPTDPNMTPAPTNPNMTPTQPGPAPTNPNMTPVPVPDPANPNGMPANPNMPSTGTGPCMATQTGQTGDCSKCKIDRSNPSSVSVSCQSSFN